ncbi:DUF1365 domain-containing protein [uncultured Sneathiella sp.]|jgi:hypothetical protein|uniref:DUF1365 domain-containing protein n=1 Tax=uncultured Sneathiella sp. TaxID=879315 RepID=UPI002591FFED|nr:DUF1365 domain-containing protein [uncultured Sneathiella sp.]
MRKSALYNGMVTHRRLNPVGHHLNYRIFYLLIDLDELANLGRCIPFLSVNKRNLVSFFTKDFGNGTSTDLKARVLAQLKLQGIDEEIASVRLLCIPRIFGYAFNPLSTYYCYDTEDTLIALVYEVSNTFGERHSYILPAGSANSKGLMKHSCPKELYVSPFMPMDCRYEFSILPPGESIALSIRQFHDDKPIMNASFIGQLSPLNRRTLGLAILKFPFNSLKVMAGIHWEALKLWLKGMKLVPRPDANARNTAPTTPPMIEKYQEK